MSSGHLRGEEKSPAALKKILAEGDTAKLLGQSVAVDTRHDVPDLGGISVDRRTVFVDRRFVADLKSGRVRIPGMTWRQVIAHIVKHEHTEKAVDDGDNPVDFYMGGPIGGAHEYATTAEHEGIADPQRYEAALLPAIKRAECEDPKNPPRDLWCGPYLDEPDADDKRLLRIFRSKGVADAFKVSKASVGYTKSSGADQCRRCENWLKDTVQDGGALAACEIVCGLVRKDRWCKKFEAR